MKGFMHVVEILLAVMLLFFVFTQFASIPAARDDWSRVKLSLLANDILQSLEKRGVNWFNGTEMESELNTTLPDNVIYSLLLENIIKPEIRIGCLCDDSEFSEVEGLLEPGWFEINGESVVFETTQVTEEEMFSLYYDVVLIYGSEDLSSHEYAMRNFLAHGKGVVEISDPEVVDDVHRDIFGMDNGEKETAGFAVKFSSASTEGGKEINRIYDYFTHIPVFHDSFESLRQWSVSSGNAEIADTGNPGPSVMLTGSECSSANTLIYTLFYKNFRRGEIDFDVYLTDGSSLFVGFGNYLASLSSSESTGYNSFYDRSMNSIGENSTDLTEPMRWTHVKIVVAGGEMKLYEDGEEVAKALGSPDSPSNITLFNLCGGVYVDNMRVTFEELHEFRNFLESFENITQAEGDGDRVVLEERGGPHACVVNYNVEGSGRTAWLSGEGSPDDDYRTLVKSLISWAAGDEYRVIGADIRRPVASYIYKPLNRDMFQNMKITLELGYLY